METGSNANATRPDLPKAPTGIDGLDEITGGGLPAGRTTLVCGGAGSGKTLLAMEFLVRGAIQFGEPGVFISFEETEPELIANVGSLGFDVAALVDQKKMALDCISTGPSEFQETGQFDLGGLFIRICNAVRSTGAKRVALDTLDALFATFSNEGILRAELQRLFRWLKQHGPNGLTTVVTGSSGKGLITRLGLAEYIADTVIALDQRLENQVCTRRMRVLKYRGSSHGANEYPFLIGKTGISVLPITSLALNNPAPKQLVSTGLPELDQMLGGKGYAKGSSILVSGDPGSGKTSLSATLINGVCQRQQRGIFFSYEESETQIRHNMESLGIDLTRWVREGLLQIHAARSTLYGLENHSVQLRNLVQTFQPELVVMDAISSFSINPNIWEIKPFVTWLVDFLKSQQVTCVCTYLLPSEEPGESTHFAISSLMDCWLMLRYREKEGEFHRSLTVFKARGLPNSNQVRQFCLSDHGIKILEPHPKAQASESRVNQLDAPP